MHTNRLAHTLCGTAAPILVALATLLHAPSAIGGNEKAASMGTSAHSWVRATAAAPWSPRSGHASVVFHDRMWVLGGIENGENRLHDVWSSTDGVSWTQVAASAPWSPRCAHQAAVLADKTWVFGGDCGDFRNDVWCSSDGINWENPVPSAPWSARVDYSLVSYNNGLWLLGGMGSRAEIMNDVWFSPDATNWTLVVEHALWTGRASHTSTAFQGKLWIAGGVNYDGATMNALNDCWSSTDGANWIQVTGQAGWHARGGHAMEMFADRLWVLGGAYLLGSGPGSHYVFLNDLWNSADGATWVQMPAAPWAARSGHSSVVFDGKLWILGGWAAVGDSAADVNDVWCLSSDAPPPYIEVSRKGWFEAGQSVTLTAVAPGMTGKGAYQWSKDGVPIPDATDNPYHIDSLTEADTGWYGCQITSAAKEVLTPQPVLIQVFPQGSLPAAGYAALILTAAACVLVGVLRRRHVPAGH